MDNKSQGYPTRLSPDNIQELCRAVALLFPEREDLFNGINDVSNTASEILDLLDELEFNKRLEILQSYSGMIQTSLRLERVLKLQKYIKAVDQWSYIDIHDDYRVEGSQKAGGLGLLDPVILGKIRGVATEVLKQVGKKILSGSFNLTQISFPIRCMQASTVLHNSINTFQMLPLYITKAVMTRDRVERFKLVIISMISSFLHTSTFEKPLNPILGETQTAELEDGTEIFSEQTSHHPPVTHFYVDGDGYKIYGYFNYTAKAGLNSVTVTNTGKRVYEFYDGYKVEATCPEELFSSTFFGTMRHESLGTIEASDTYGSACTIGFGKIKGKPSDYVTAVIKNPNGIELGTLQGSYLGYLEFDGVRYWDARYVRPYRLKYKEILPSDSECRRDISVLRSGQIEQAQAEKENLENIQRNDRKLRSKYGPK